MKYQITKILFVLVCLITAQFVIGGENLQEHQAQTLAGHGFQLLQKARQTGEGNLYADAETIFNKALQLDAANTPSMNGLGIILLNRHQFRQALEWGQRSFDLNPYDGSSCGILFDAYIELGEYVKAEQMLNRMFELRPDAAAYSRLSYLHELKGDPQGAIAAMQFAVRIGSGNAEYMNWCQVHLGNLFFQMGDLQTASRHYQQVQERDPGYEPALAGSARVSAATGDYPTSIFLNLRALETAPIAEYMTALAEVYQAASMKTAANELYDKALHLLKKEKSSGMDVDDEIASLLIISGKDARKALDLAKAAYFRRPTINNADILAWCYFKNGLLEKASEIADAALKLNTQYAHLYFHAAMIAKENGDLQKAKDLLKQVLKINPYFSLADAPLARQTLFELEETASLK